MAFSKTSYRSRRNKGLRGQGDKPKAKVTPGQGGHLVRGPKGFQSVNRKQARQKLRSRHYDDDRLVVVGRAKQTVRYDDDGNVVERKLGKVIKRKIEDKQGRPFTSKGVRHPEGKPKYTGPTYNPEVSNHERVFRQRIKSGRIKRPQEVVDGKSI